MRSKQRSWPIVHELPRNFILLCVAAAYSIPAARAEAIVIGQIEQPGDIAIPGGITGITFDGGMDALVINGFGTTVYSLSLQSAMVTPTFPLTTPEVNTRSLAFDAATGQYFTSRRFPPADDFLSTLNLTSGAVTDIGVMGTFNFLDLAIDPLTGDLWLGNDCANIACTSVQGGSLWEVNASTGSATAVLTVGTSLGQLTAFAISPQGLFFVASAPATTTSSPLIYEIDPVTGKATFITDTGLAPLSYITSMAFDPSTDALYAVQVLNSLNSNGTSTSANYLDQITGIPSPVPEPGTAASLLIGLGLAGTIGLRRQRRSQRNAELGQP